jgi:hypothetical protein
MYADEAGRTGDQGDADADPRLERLVEAINDGCMLAKFNPYTGAAEVGMRLFVKDLASRLEGSEAVLCAVPTEVGTGRRPAPGFLVVTGSRAILEWEDAAHPDAKVVEEMDRAAIASVAAKHFRLGLLAGWRTSMTVTGPLEWHLRVVDAKHGDIGRHVQRLLGQPPTGQDAPTGR